MLNIINILFIVFLTFLVLYKEKYFLLAILYSLFIPHDLVYENLASGMEFILIAYFFALFVFTRFYSGLRFRIDSFAQLTLLMALIMSLYACVTALRIGELNPTLVFYSIGYFCFSFIYLMLLNTIDRHNLDDKRIILFSIIILAIITAALAGPALEFLFFESSGEANAFFLLEQGGGYIWLGGINARSRLLGVCILFMFTVLAHRVELKKILLMIPILIPSFFILISYTSRSAVLALMLSIASFFLINIFSNKNSGYEKFKYLMFTVITGLGLISIVLLNQNFIDKVLVLFIPQVGSEFAFVRYEIINEVLKSAQDTLFLGNGFLHNNLDPNAYESNILSTGKRAHNLIAALILDTGVFGLTVFSMVLISMFRIFNRYRTSFLYNSFYSSIVFPQIVYFITSSLFTDSVIFRPRATIFLLIFLALLSNMNYKNIIRKPIENV